MAFNASGLYVAHWIKTVGGTAYTTRFIIDLSSTSNKVALYNNTLTISFEGTTTGDYAAYTTTNEASTTTNGYTAGGIALTAGYSQSWAITNQSTGMARYYHNALTWSSSTITAYGAIWYNDAVTAGDTGGVADPAYVAVSFGAAYTSTNGNFVVTPNTNGVFTIDFLP